MRRRCSVNDAVACQGVRQPLQVGKSVLVAIVSDGQSDRQVLRSIKLTRAGGAACECDGSCGGQLQRGDRIGCGRQGANISRSQRHRALLAVNASHRFRVVDLVIAIGGD